MPIFLRIGHQSEILTVQLLSRNVSEGVSLLLLSTHHAFEAHESICWGSGTLEMQNRGAILRYVVRQMAWQRYGMAGLCISVKQ